MEIKGEQINEALKNIYNKNIDVKKQIEPTLFHHTWSNLNNTVDITFGKVEFGNPDYDFVNQLKNNNAVFAAFKAHREQNDLIPNLWDDNGKLRSFDDFKKANSHIVSKYEHWLRTEYDTAVIRARNAANFQKFKRDADLYPNLEWLPSTSVEPRGEHVKFYGIIKPINDPFWSNNYPGDLWNCKCGITSTDKEPTENTPSNDYIKPQGLEENPATSGALFSNKNAYVKNAYDGANEAVEDFVAKQIIKKRRTEIKEEAKKFKDVIFENKNFKNNVVLSNRNIKEILNQPHKHLYEKNESLLKIDEIYRESEYLGMLTKDKKTDNFDSYLFETTIANQKSWIIVRKYDLSKEYSIYSISDQKGLKKFIKK